MFVFHLKVQSRLHFNSFYKFRDPHDLALSVNGQALYVGQIHPNRIDSFDVLN